jgi:glutamyl-tRNA reductase
MDNVFVYDVDDLQQVAEENLAVRAREAALAERIVEEELDSFLSWRRSLELAPTIVALRKRFGQIADEEVRRALPRLEGSTQADRAVVEAMGRSLVNKLLHQPMTQLKAGAGEPDGPFLIDAVRRLFAISEEVPAEKEPSTESGAEATVTHLSASASGSGSTGESK